MARDGDLNARFEAARTLLHGGRPAEALAAFEEILRSHPRDLPTLVSRGVALVTLGRGPEAQASWREALALSPHHPVILSNLGSQLIETEKFDEALALAEATLAAIPTHGRALLLRGDALHGFGRFEEALASYALAPADTELAYDKLSKMGLTEAALQHHQAALELLNQAVTLNPDDPFARFRRGMVRLSTRDFGGWDDYEARWRLPMFLVRSGGVVTPGLASALTLRATADDLKNQRVLVLGEQGIGDQLMFASMLPDLAATAASVACVCDARLVRLLSGSLPGIAFTGPKDAKIGRGQVDRIMAMGSLGHAFRGPGQRFPSAPYLRPSAEARTRWAARLGPRTGALRVGLSWRGGLPSTRRRKRSLTLDQLAPILELAGCEFFSLQYGPIGGELADRPVRAFDGRDFDDFDDLAALAAELDVVVSVQTALVHVCGAIGKECLTLAPHNPEWRYAAEGSTMPWYGSVRIFRQAQAGEWAPVIAQAAGALRARLAARSSDFIEDHELG